MALDVDGEGGDRSVAGLVVARRGAVRPTGAADLPWVVLDGAGVAIEPVSEFLRELLACGNGASSCRSYSLDHLSRKRPIQALCLMRRSPCANHEYREAAESEWQEFEEHFDERKVELGACRRTYGTSCPHEHACVRCPMLQVEPQMLPRLDEIEMDLNARRDRAVSAGWRGEIEGIEVTLDHLRSKRDRARRIGPAGPVTLPMPTVRDQTSL